uniref:Uncharacterized protein n=1 Tax=Anguilla anguilla TaxID=7936 RepID=A0A0E9PXG7_ANGAN
MVILQQRYSQIQQNTSQFLIVFHSLHL